MSRGEDVGSQRKEKGDRGDEDNRKKVAERRERGSGVREAVR